MRTGKYRHILAHVERRFFVIQRDHAWRGEDVIFAVGGKRSHQRTKITVKEAGRQASEARPFHGAIFNLADWQAGGAELHAAVLAGPLHAEIQAVPVLHFRDDGFHQHLRTTDVELVDHLLKGVHHVRLGGNHQRVGCFVGGNVQIAGRWRGFRLRRAGLVLQLLADAGEYRHHLGGAGILEIEDAGIPLVVLLAIQLMDQGAGPRARIFRTADHQAVGFVIGHHFGRQLRRVLPFLLFVVEVIQHLRELFGGRKAQRHDFTTLNTVFVHALDQIHQTVHHRGFTG